MAKEKDKEAKQDTAKESKPEKGPEKGNAAAKDAKGKKEEKEGAEGKESKITKPGAKQDPAGAEQPVSKAQAIKNFFKKGFGSVPIVVYALVLLNIVAMGSILGYIYYMKFVYTRPIITEKSAREEIDKAKDGTSEIIEYKMDPFTVNMSKAKGRRYINAKFVLIAVNWETRDELDKKVDKIRDAVINILDDKYPEELITVQGKLFLKDQIVTEVNRILVRGSIKEVFIESFLIQ